MSTIRQVAILEPVVYDYDEGALCLCEALKPRSEVLAPTHLARGHLTGSHTVGFLTNHALVVTFATL